MTVQILRDLRGQFGDVRDQDQRPTCLAFAASDAHAALRSPWEALSVEFAFHHAQRRAGRSLSVGATLPAMLSTLLEDGQPVESGCPYLMVVPPDWKPAEDIGPVFRRRGEKGGDTVGDIIARLDVGRSVLVLMTLSSAFDFATASAGGIVDQPAGEPLNPHRRHAVIAAGHGLVGGQRVVLIRNSWGEEWGDQGYAWLTEAYLAPRVFRIGILTEDPDVSTHAAAA
jgi:hypothetical protein